MVGTIPNIVFVILLAIATGYLTFLTTKGGLTDNRFSGFWKKLTQRGRLVLLTLFLISILLGLQEWNSQIKNDDREVVLKNERAQRDSTITNGIKSGVDSNRKILFGELSEALAKQGLQFDSSQKRVEKLVKDSANRKTIVVTGDLPLLSFCDEDGLKLGFKTKDSFQYFMKVCSLSAACIVETLEIYAIVSSYQDFEVFNDLLYTHPPQKIFLKNIGIQKDGFKYLDLYFMGAIAIDKIKTIIVYIKGSYTDSYGKNKKEISQVAVLDIITTKWGIMLSPYDDKIIEFLKKERVL